MVERIILSTDEQGIVALLVGGQEQEIDAARRH
jgi:hypothetical protein